MKTTKYLDKEEQELIESFSNIDKNNLKKPSRKEQQEFKKAAKQYIANETKMNIRIDPYELQIIKKFADEAGLKYQTFIKSIVHKYITGQLVEKRTK